MTRRFRLSWLVRVGPLYFAMKSPRALVPPNEGRPLFRAFGWRVFAGVL